MGWISSIIYPLFRALLKTFSLVIAEKLILSKYFIYFLFFTIDGCFIRDGDFEYNVRGYNYDDWISKKLPSPEACQKWCQGTKECEMFVYGTKDFSDKVQLLKGSKESMESLWAQQSVCYLMKNYQVIDRLTTSQLTTNYRLSRLVAGPKFCPIYGEYILFLDSIYMIALMHK